jgi:acylaminoacyl-peptidase
MPGGDPLSLTNLPQGVSDLAWSPDSNCLAVVAADRSAAPPRRDGDPPPSDYRYIDRLQYMLNGEGFLHDRVVQLWSVDVESGRVRRLTRGRTDVSGPAWSPDGTRIAFAADRSRNADLAERSDIVVVDAATGRERVITGGRRAIFRAPQWLPDGRTIAAIGHRLERGGGTRSDLWLFAADGSDAGPNAGRNLTAAHDLMLYAGMAGDLTPSEPFVLRVTRDGRWISFIAPDNQGAGELWRLRVQDARVERLTEGRHQISSFDAVSVRGATRYAVIRSDATTPAEVELLDVPDRGRGPTVPARRRVTDLNTAAIADIDAIEPEERWTEVDGRRIQGWFFPPRGAARGEPAPPLVAEIHGGPHAYYGWTPMWEFQVLAGAGIGVYASNPRGSEGYGEAFNAANHRDWADGPARDVLGGIDALVAEGKADPERLGLTGGSYGGYLTTWIIAHDQRFRAALTARSVSDVAMLMLTGDISGGEFGRQEFGVTPWDDPDYYRAISPLTYAANIRTPLLIQHAENDIRTTVGQAEALFTVLRSLRRPVRFMRVPDENHELTRSGTPFRRIENLVQVRDWFVHFLVSGRRTMPAVPKGRRRAPAARAAASAAATRSGGRGRVRKGP